MTFSGHGRGASMNGVPESADLRDGVIRFHRRPDRFGLNAGRALGGVSGEP